MNTDVMRRRAKGALVPTWPQVRTFTAAEVEENERAQREWQRGHGDTAGTIAEWVYDIRRRAGFGVHVDVRLADGRPMSEHQWPGSGPLTVTITPSEGQ